MSTLPDVRVGDPIHHQALAVFPLFSAPDGAVDYLLADEAIQAGSVTVQEVNEGGSVPNLLVTNQGDSRVLFLEGEELRGAKQNRVLNTSVLIAAHHPGQLRRAGPLAASVAAFRRGQPFFLEAAAHPQADRDPLGARRPGPSFRSGQGLARSRPAK